MADDTDATRRLMDCLPLSSTPSDYPRILSRPPWSDRRKKTDDVSLSLPHTHTHTRKFNNGESIVGEEKGERRKAEARKGIRDEGFK